MRFLSKSKLIAFRQCPKRLWLEIHRAKLREDSAGTQARFKTGDDVGDIARHLYDPDKNGAKIDVGTEGYEEAFARSKRLLAESNRPIFEAGFKADGGLAFADVMLPTNDGDGQHAWKMVEVKSSASVKDYHRDDVAVQTFVAQSAGVKVTSVAVACIDSNWIYPGDKDYRGILVETDLTAETFARGEEVKAWIADAQKVAAQSDEVAMPMGDHCYEPFECGFCNYCKQISPQPDYPIDWLPKLSKELRGKLAAMGVDDLRQVPDEVLDKKQLMVKNTTLTNSVFFDVDGAAEDLAPHGFPAYFLDFETIQFAVPIWKGTHPYQSIPFQFSVHTLAQSGQLAQTAFLNLSGNDPTKLFAEALILACGDSGPVFVYNEAFEKSRIRELAEQFHELAQPLLAINDRVVDLLPIARNRYYHPSQQGSWSIKAVLPAAVPELSYAALDGVKDGGMAMNAYSEATHPNTTAIRKREIEQQLLAYCRLDTFAMVRLWQFFNGHGESALKDLP